ncbi:MAG: hypothetical protein ACSLFK_07195 [Gemmatimonadaceae bacterium]
MAKLWAIIKREYMERVRTKWFIFATIFGPIFFGAMFIIPAVLAKRGQATAEFSNMRILDATRSGVGQRIAEGVARTRPAGSSTPEVILVLPGAMSEAESTATRQVMAKQLSGYLVVDVQTLDGEGVKYAGRNATSLGDM